jgi:hypothetical protein
MNTIDKDTTEIHVFKTDIKLKDFIKLQTLLNNLPGIIQWNLDTEDIDNVLRIESTDVDSNKIINQITQAGYYCQELPD